MARDLPASALHVSTAVFVATSWLNANVVTLLRPDSSVVALLESRDEYCQRRVIHVVEFVDGDQYAIVVQRLASKASGTRRNAHDLWRDHSSIGYIKVFLKVPSTLGQSFKSTVGVNRQVLATRRSGSP